MFSSSDQTYSWSRASMMTKFIVVFASFLTILAVALSTYAWAADSAPALDGGTPVTDREYIAFRDASDPVFKDTLWIQDVTECKNDQAECNANSGAGLNSKSYQVAYCLNQASLMPYDMENHQPKMKYDMNTGLWTNAQKYWRYEPSDKLIKNFVKENAGKDANLRAIKKVLYYGYHDADDSQWQKDNNIQDIEFREGTQYALWHYTDNLDPYNTSGWAWPNQNVKKVFDYLVDKDNKLADAPVDFKVNFFHTDETEGGKEFQNLVSVRTVATPEEPKPNKPEPKRTKVQFKKVDSSDTPLSGVKIRVYAKSKLEGDESILFDKTVALTNNDAAVLEGLETDVTYYIEETEVPAGYTKRNFEMHVDKDGKITFAGDTAPYGMSAPGNPDESGFIADNTVTLKNDLEVPDGSAAKLGTTVHAGDVAATNDTPATVSDGTVKVTDTVKYEGFVPDTYTFTGRLMKVVDGKAVEPEVKKVTKEVVLAAGQDVGTVEMDFGNVALEQGVTYVVYETAESHNNVIKPAGSAEKTKLVVKHENPSDKAQTIVVKTDGEMTLKTTVSVGSDKATEEKPLEKVVTDEELAAGISLHDTVNYTGLDAASEYKLIGVLNKVEGETVTPIAASVTQTFKPDTQNIMIVNFSSVKGLEVGKNYVVYEYLFKSGDELTTQTGDKNISDADKAKARAKHENPKDNAQTVLFKKNEPTPTAPELKTTVQYDGAQASADHELIKKMTEDDLKEKMLVEDIVAYKGLDTTKQYKLIAVLNEVIDGKAVPTRSFVTEAFTPSAQDGTHTVELNTMPFDLTVEEGKDHRYVIFEYLVPGDAKLVTEEGADGGINEADKDKVIAKHEDPTDKGQTLVLQNKTYKPAKAKIAVAKKLVGRDWQEGDEFTFSINPDDEYTPKAKAPVQVTINKNTPEHKAEFGEIEFTDSGTFDYKIYEAKGNIANLDYVKDPILVKVQVTEEPADSGTLVARVLYPENTTAVTFTNTYHEPTPTEQSLKTTVKANESTASTDKEATVPAGEVSVVDTVAYKGLEVGKEYVLQAELMENGTKAIKTVYHTFTPAQADGEEAVDFGKVKLEAGNKYVVFESAIKTEDADKSGEGDNATYKEKDGKSWLEHKDATDKAQTVVVEKPTDPNPPTPTPEEPKSSLKTTVSVDGKASTETAPVVVKANEAATVVDTIDYKGLVAGKEYTFSGRLMLIESGKDPQEVATAETKEVVAQADGTATVTFENVKLEASKTYVVFETATSTEKVVGEGDQAKQHVVKHEDPKDKAQTVVVENPDGTTPPAPEVPDKPGTPDPNPPTPPAPNIPNKPGNPDPNKPNNPTPPAPNTPEKPGWPTPDVPSKPGNPSPNTPDKPGNPSPNTPHKPGQPKLGHYVPKTGDETLYGAYGVLALASVVGVYGVSRLRKQS